MRAGGVFIMPPVEPSLTMSKSSRMAPTGAGGAIVPALIATLIVQLFRVATLRDPVLMWGEVALFIVVSFLLKHFLTKKIVVSDRRTQNVAAIITSQIGSLVLVLLFVVCQVVLRANDIGDAYEVVSIALLQYIALYLALLGKLPGCEKASLVLSGAVVFFVCCMTARFDLLALAGCFAVSALWWLLGVYWYRLDDKAIDGNSRMLPIRASFLAVVSLLVALVAGAVCLAPLSKGTITAINGFTPFSGGENGRQDPFARSGIGEGNMLTAGENATTTGAVDSDQFIEDDKPSIYDMISEKYEGPLAKPRRNRAVAINSIAKHLHDVKQSETSGKTFRTMRDSEQPNDTDLENRVTDALLFVEGSVPARFSVGSYQHFDGWDWQTKDVLNEKLATPIIQLETEFGKPTFSLSRFERDFLTSSRIHRVKIMRLETDKLPAPSFLRSWRIDFVDNKTFFEWNDLGDIRFACDAIPPHTVIDMESLVPNFHTMRKLGDLRSTLNSLKSMSATARKTRKQSQAASAKLATGESVYLQVPDHSATLELKNRVAQWTQGIQPGWSQVEAIVQHVREDFEVNANWATDPEIENSVGLFLDLNEGPSYMFATTCAMALRLAGYKTRLANGFVIRTEDYDRLARQSAVTTDSVHLWPEVCLEDQYWIPVEPTPGYPMPYNTATIWQRTVAAMMGVWAWIWAHPIFSLLTVLAVSMAWFWRADIVTASMLIWWHVVRLSWPRGLLTATRQLIDTRFWAAGDSRLKSQTVHAWYQRVEPELNGFIDSWNAKNYSDIVRVDSGNRLVTNCRETVKRLTLGRIREFVSSSDLRS